MKEYARFFTKSAIFDGKITPFHCWYITEQLRVISTECKGSLVKVASLSTTRSPVSFPLEVLQN